MDVPAARLGACLHHARHCSRVLAFPQLPCRLEVVLLQFLIFPTWHATRIRMQLVSVSHLTHAEYGVLGTSLARSAGVESCVDLRQKVTRALYSCILAFRKHPHVPLPLFLHGPRTTPAERTCHSQIRRPLMQVDILLRWPKAPNRTDPFQT